MGRPRKEVDFDIAEKAAALMCTGEEIAHLCEVSYDTLERRIKELGYKNFAEWFGEKSAPGLKALRRWQFDAAKKGSAAMLIWLGKQYLKQTDKMEQTNKDEKVYVNVFNNENPIRKDTKAG